MTVKNKQGSLFDARLERIARGLRASRDRRPDAPFADDEFVRELAIEGLQTLDAVKREIDSYAHTVAGRIVTGFGRQVGDDEASRIAAWVVNGFPWTQSHYSDPKEPRPKPDGGQIHA